ncbi:MAG: hypothetical protein ACM3KM_04095 [Acidobacteriaceae bacterium]
MIKYIDDFLDRTTMYRLVLYYLIGLIIAAIGLGFFHLIPYSPFPLIYSSLVLVAASWVFNKFFAWFFDVPANLESVYITALILALIISPFDKNIASQTMFLIWASAIAMGSKFLINLRNKHIFNPAALAVVLTSLILKQSASWWVGTSWMLPFVLVGGILTVRKLRRFDAVIAFVIAALAAVLILTPNRSLSTLSNVVLVSPLFFLASVMLTEPLTMPPGKDGRIAYAILVGWLFAPQTHIGTYYFTPEMALLVGNLFAYVISPKQRQAFKLIEKRRIADGVFEFVFKKAWPVKFKPGQYMEWTIGAAKSDSRGNRRYFTIASSPTEERLILGVKFYPKPSTFKNTLAALKPGQSLIGSQLAGEFTLPKDKTKKLVFFAGGIGITPFRSMLKYLIDNNEKRAITVLYANRTIKEIAYADVLAEAQDKLGVNTYFALSDKNSVPSGWKGHVGYFGPEQIASAVPDYKDSTFYISGSHGLVESIGDILLRMGVGRSNIKKDFFPGLV